MRLQKPSPAMLVALVALFVALGGSSYAALVVTGKTVRNGSLTGKDVKRNSLTGRQIKESKLGEVAAARLAGRAGTASTADAATTATNALNANTVGGKSADQLGVKAYAYVEADGSLPPARAKNVISAAVPAAPFAHAKCFQLSFTPNIGLATSAATDNPRIVAVATERSVIDAVCGDTGAEAVAYSVNNAGAPTPSALSVLFE